MKIQALITLLLDSSIAIGNPENYRESDQKRMLQRLQEATSELDNFQAVEADVVTLFEPASSDGYAPTGDGVFYPSASEAATFASDKHQAYATTPIQHRCIPDGTGRYIRIHHGEPVALICSKQAREDIRARALAKLTTEEREALES